MTWATSLLPTGNGVLQVRLKEAEGNERQRREAADALQLRLERHEQQSSQVLT